MCLLQGLVGVENGARFRYTRSRDYQTPTRHALFGSGSSWKTHLKFRVVCSPLSPAPGDATAADVLISLQDLRISLREIFPREIMHEFRNIEKHPSMQYGRLTV